MFWGLLFCYFCVFVSSLGCFVFVFFAVPCSFLMLLNINLLVYLMLALHKQTRKTRRAKRKKERKKGRKERKQRETQKDKPTETKK